MSDRGQSLVDAGVAFAMFLLLAAAGLGLFGVAVRDFARARASLAWPPVEGVVLSRSADDSADIRYVYVAAGATHESRRVRFLTGLVFPAPTDDLRPGASVTVFVDPDDASFAVLRPGGSGPLFAVAVLVASLLTFIGVGGVIRTLSLLRLPEAVRRARL
jgi:hypothetical protein